MPASSDRTRTRILSAAERLFARSGLGSTSLRAIAREAGVSFALVSYHFGTREDLYRAIFERRYGPPSAERLARLASIDPGAPDGRALERIVAAFVEPVLKLRQQRGARHFATLLAREASDPEEARRGILERYVDPTAHAFMAALVRALPGLSAADVAWGYQFLVGALVLHLADTSRTTRLSRGAARSGDSEAVLARLVDFACGGLRALAAHSAPAASTAPPAARAPGPGPRPRRTTSRRPPA